MKVYKITYKRKDKKGIWKLSYSIKTANTEDEAVAKLGQCYSLIKSVEFLGYKRGTAPKHLSK